MLPKPKYGTENQKKKVLSLTSFGLSRVVQVKDWIQRLSQLPGCGFALPVLTHGPDVHCLGMKTAVEEFLWLQKDSETSLFGKHSEEKT